jgi:hypothetical protein
MATKDQLVTENAQLSNTLEVIVERLAELELALEDTDWIRMSLDGSREFSNAGLAKIITLARLAYLKNPLINRAVSVQAFYVWGQGVNVEAKPAEVDAVVQGFLDHPKNQVELTSHQARTAKEVTLQLEANLFLVLFTNTSTGRVVVRKIPVDEILAGDIITNPDDAREPWFYKRVWTQRTFVALSGQTAYSSQTAYYPDWRYRPAAAERPAEIAGDPVHWDQPVFHVKVGGLEDMRFGVPEVYSALDWAKAVKTDLERYATLRAALARYAHKITTTGGSAGVAAAKAKLGTTLGAGGSETNPPPVTASTFVSTAGQTLEPYNTRNTLPNPDEAKRLGLMVAAGTGIPETILFGDADVGNLATAKTLDRPTELKMLDRQTLWADVLKDLLGFVVEQAARRANGTLGGVVTVTDDPDDASVVTLSVAGEDGKPASVQFQIVFPEILERSVTERVEAVVAATTLGSSQGTPAGTLQPRQTIALLLQALGVDDIDELLDEFAPAGTTWAEIQADLAPPPAEPVPPEEPPAEAETREALREVRAALVDLVAASRAPAASA